MVLSPAQSAEFIVRNAINVAIKPKGILNLTKKVLSFNFKLIIFLLKYVFIIYIPYKVIDALISKQIDVGSFPQHPNHPKANDPTACNWLFLLGTLNFSLWQPAPGSGIKWRVGGSAGCFALSAAIKRAIGRGIDITNPKVYSQLTLNELDAILEGDVPTVKCPLLAERLQCLHQVGEVLLAKFDGNFENCIKAADGSANGLLTHLAEHFPCFRDEATFAGERVSFYRRSQILVVDLWNCYRGQGLGHFEDINGLTGFSDFRRPQVLVYFGCLEYSQELMDLLSKKYTFLENGCAEEVEIRGASVQVVELLREQVLDEIRLNHPVISSSGFNSILLDNFLWSHWKRLDKELEDIPYHKTISVYY